MEKRSSSYETGKKPPNKNPADIPVGILRADLAKTGRLSAYFQGDLTSPQSSIDSRHSVTFAEDSVKSDSSKCNSFNNTASKMDKPQYPSVTTEAEGEESDQEDYSATVNAIMIRRASTRKSRRRRGSSPFSPDILPGTENGRRRSSVFTTSSGDTAITIDENLAAEATQDEVFENIRLHKEVLSSVKMQPWNMRKKLKLVIQAKAYVKQHEGVLQERFAQTHSTRDMLARWNIYIAKKWQHWRREMLNLSMWFIPWELKIKEIESHFGSVVASYFIFLRWLFWVNLVIAIVLISFVAIPEFLLTVICASEVTGSLYPLVYLNRLYNYTPPEDEVTFFLYERNNLSKCDQIFIGNKRSLDESRFNSDLPTKIIVHGWTHSKDVPWLIEMREVMANVGLWNIIVVDWAPLSHVIYVEARVHNLVVSKQLANFILFLESYKYIDVSSVHLIGHSMGAQISALASYKIKSQIQEKVGRITGLDPAAPLYEWPHIESLDELLDPSDAIFVDVIHTNGRHLGVMTPAGHVDYYPNGGELQEGCVFWICSHLRSCELWTASIQKPDLFKAYSYEAFDRYLEGKLDNLKTYPMGIAASSKIPRGLYFVRTNGEYKKYITTKTTLIDSLTLENKAH